MIADRSMARDFARAWAEIARLRGGRVERYAVDGSDELLLRVEFGDPRRPAVLLTAGVHGDEPAGPAALLALALDGGLPAHFRYQIWPCTNPSGFLAGTRNNAVGRDVNRSFHDGGTTAEARAIVAATERVRFAMALDFHEDFEADGFYLYEPLHPGVRPIGHAIVETLRAHGLPLHGLAAGFDLGYCRRATATPQLEVGRVLSTPSVELGYNGWPLGTYVLVRGCRRVLTFETPRAHPWADRIAMHVIAARAALAQLLAALPQAGAAARRVRLRDARGTARW